MVDEHFQARVAGENVGIARGVEQCHQVAGGLLVVTARDVARDPIPFRPDPARERGLVQSERARIVTADDEGGLGRTARRRVGGLVVAEQLVCTGQQILLIRAKDVVGIPVSGLQLRGGGYQALAAVQDCEDHLAKGDLVVAVGAGCQLVNREEPQLVSMHVLRREIPVGRCHNVVATGSPSAAIMVLFGGRWQQGLERLLTLPLTSV
ncbi:hypothetical protein ACTD5D_01990 [Nocardia takedensis]|uniref:hypothetical protein n=1 Tax=Nocardia TaxID=1817 RepID=UPI0024544D42|nr:MULTISPECIES: hypothetical protein [Nocardia]